jgi:hypothetical protein
LSDGGGRKETFLFWPDGWLEPTSQRLLARCVLKKSKFFYCVANRQIGTFCKIHRITKNEQFDTLLQCGMFSQM